jgi:hypothetical protein
LTVRDADQISCSTETIVNEETTTHIRQNGLYASSTGSSSQEELAVKSTPAAASTAGTPS